jgi:hypothetical protein
MESLLWKARYTKVNNLQLKAKVKWRNRINKVDMEHIDMMMYPKVEVSNLCWRVHAKSIPYDPSQI